VEYVGDCRGLGRYNVEISVFKVLAINAMYGNLFSSETQDPGKFITGKMPSSNRNASQNPSQPGFFLGFDVLYSIIKTEIYKGRR
jgi:hypothetical protein